MRQLQAPHRVCRAGLQGTIAACTKATQNDRDKKTRASTKRIPTTCLRQQHHLQHQLLQWVLLVSQQRRQLHQHQLHSVG